MLPRLLAVANNIDPGPQLVVEDNRKASRLPASNSSLDSFRATTGSLAAPAEGFGKLPAVDVGSHVFIVISLLYGFSKARN